MRTVDHAASDLLFCLHAPRGMVNVLPVTDNQGAYLVVWVDTNYRRQLQSIPNKFEGYSVKVIERPKAVAFGQ